MNEHGPVEIRTATLDTIETSQRLIDLVAVPYDTTATVEYDGRLIEESVAPGAFDGVHNRVAQGRIKQVFLEHRRDEWVGRVAALDTRRTDGLGATLKIRQTPEGDQALRDAIDGMYAASVGFAVAPRDQEWDGRDRRRIVKAYLDHIALTYSPAYTGTAVLAVRSAPAVIELSSTPNLDRILSQRAAQRYR